MRALTLAALSATLLTVAGCSTHPLPEDVSRKSTVDIVKRMRCEIREAVNKLSSADNVELEGTVVGFDFVLKMTEENKATAGKLSFADPLARGKFTLDLTGSAEKERFNERRFRVVDNMYKLSLEENCSEQEQRANFVYPITGRIGLDELVFTYWKLKDVTSFKPYEDDDQRAFIDKLLFTTTLSAGLSPTIQIDSPAGGFELTNASVAGNVVRKDEHQVTVAIVQYVETIVVEVPGKPKPKKPKGGPSGSPAADSGPELAPVRKTRRIIVDPSAATRAVNRALNRESVRDDFRDYGFPVVPRDLR